METRKALFVGINDYEGAPLRGAVPDATQMHALLVKHEKEDPNFTSQLLVSGKQQVTGKLLKEKIKQVFQKECDMALFYYSGHGTMRDGRFHLVAQDRDYVDFEWLIHQLSESKHKEVLIILDCCFAGGAGNMDQTRFPHTLLREGVTILSATTADDFATERMGAGRFTNLLVRGLQGAAADLFGHVTPASLFAYADIFLGMWEQRPVFKCNVKRMTPIRYCIPVIRKRYLRRLPEWFPTPDQSLPLTLGHIPSPSEDTSESLNLLQILQEMERQGLVRPEVHRSLPEAAQGGGNVLLTDKGKEIWALAKAERI